MLYSNMEYLKKYEKEIPQTWDELLETAKYILENEKEKGNDKLIGYNGYIPGTINMICINYILYYNLRDHNFFNFYFNILDYEATLNSVEDYIYSFRNSLNSSFPDYKTQEFKNALIKLKQIKNEISSSNIIYIIKIWFE